MRDVAFPYHVDGRGRTALAESDDAHIRDLVESLLFTVPGERVNRPDFGCGLMSLVFEPDNVALAATLQALVQGALQQWLGSRIRVLEVVADATGGVLTIEVRYAVIATGQDRTATFSRRVGA